MSGAARRTCTVNSDRPRSTVAGSGSLYSAMITMVAGPADMRGSWYGVDFGAAGDHQPDVHAVAVMPLAASVR